ncbi:DUF1800 domain-containing protein [Maribacter sp. 2307ULW6-5]|uniref:DUF1800 domain-containing protein n=1 Tax=Maribacter sp. 2307ULW6-5 TaxID=3386275 RepID=UPI0039BCD840
MERKHIQHIFNRMGFGALPSELDARAGLNKKTVVGNLLAASKRVEPLVMELSELKAMSSPQNLRNASEEKKRELRKLSREKIKGYNQLWLQRLLTSGQTVREKMTLFWANVFVCRDNHIFHVQQYNNLLRTHALGNLKEFVKAVAREPAMSKYLNNRQNVKQNPNENFARELMELFTLGNGHYGEDDIKEAARAFTGWSFKPNGEFFLRQKQHDAGQKTFFGQTGNFNGDDIIDIIFQQRQCARFICEKIYRYFVHPEVDVARLDEMVSVFYGNYDIGKLMRYILLSDWFYDEKNIGAKIKSPVELLMGIQRIVPLTFEKGKHLMDLQKMMGQVLLYPPNVAGWKQDRYWIDSNTLLFRLKLASVLLNDAVINVDRKGEFEDSFEAYYRRTRNARRNIKIERDWTLFEREFAALGDDVLEKTLLVGTIDQDTRVFLNGLSSKDKKDYLVQLMSLPEYQLC